MYSGVCWGVVYTGVHRVQWCAQGYPGVLGAVRASPVVQMVKTLQTMQETQAGSPGQDDPLEEGTATHSSILAWRIRWTEEPGGLQSMGLERVGHD